MASTYLKQLSTERTEDRGAILGVGSFAVLMLFLPIASAFVVASAYFSLFIWFVLGCCVCFLPLAGVMAVRCLCLHEGSGKRWAMVSVVMLGLIIVGLFVWSVPMLRANL